MQSKNTSVNAEQRTQPKAPINPPQQPQTTITVNSQQAHSLRFNIKTANATEAAHLFREVTSKIRPFSDSLLGDTPRCTDDLGLDLDHHRELRNFSSEDTLARFKTHLIETIRHSRELGYKPQPIITDIGRSKYGLCYTISSGAAEIRIFPRDDDWCIKGKANYFHPYGVSKKLQKLGFTTSVSSKRKS